MIAVNGYLRQLVYPPAVSDEARDVMRQAIADLIVDPEFIAESTKAGFTVSYAPGEEQDKALATMSSASQELLDKYAGFLKPQE
jgi:tripartite-type tricarboxylate transporter receptor subunit TctC